jgi:hypothetical protein
MAIQNTGNARNILVGASPLFLTVEDSTVDGYIEDMEAGSPNAGTLLRNTKVPAFSPSQSYTTTLNAVETTPGVNGAAYRNVGYTNNGLQITYNPTYDSVTVDQLLDTAKLFKSAMEVMIATEMSEGTLENVLVVFGQKAETLNAGVLGLEAGALGAAPTERQLIAVGQAPTTLANSNTERVYYARRVLSVQQSQFSLSRSTPTTFPVTFRLLPSGSSSYVGSEYGKIIDRVITTA